ncbi:MAG: restriction endonuclease subunit S [Burkholderiaceae bacterium]|nr:restriction endonuclease subunit S [Burkholderiaceae bacterium]
MSASASARLGDFVEILSGFAFDAANFSDEGDIALIRIRDVLRGRSNTFYRGAYDEKYLINEGEILIGMDGEFNRARWQSAPALLNQRVCKISSNSPRLADEYLFHFLPAALKSIEDATSFVTVKHLSAKQIREIEIPLPPVEEQRRIAAILDQAETLRTQRRQALAQLDSLTQSLLLDMFGDALASTNRIPMGELVDEFRYGTSEKSGASGFPALRIPNVASGTLDLTELKTVTVETAEFNRLQLLSGDILFVRTNGNPDYVGRCAVFEPALVANSGFEPNEFIYASYLIRARLKGRDLLPLVLQHYLSEGEGRRALRARCKTSAGQYNINTEGLGAIPVPLFPTAFQQTFATRIKAIEALKAIHRTALAELDALFASLQQRAFAGEL